MNQFQIIIITDGDLTAKRAIEKASENLDLQIIYESAGNPTSCPGEILIEKIKQTEMNPALVMFDDEGEPGLGQGEQAILTVISDPQIEVLGVLAVASNLKEAKGIKPDFSITRDGEIISNPVDKSGKAEQKGHKILEGDTIDVLNSLQDTLIIGIGDLGKMENKDSIKEGAPITTKAIKEILKRGGA